MNFISMDFETANYQPYSACSLALVMVEKNKIVDEYYSLINPQTDFFYRNIQIHGIRPKDVADAPLFPEVWQEIQHYFQDNRLVIAHNASFDNGVLASCLEHYGIQQPHYLSLCTVRTSRKLFPEMPNHKLNTVCQELGISLEHHHDALEDSRACAEILMYQENHFGPEPLKQLIQLR